MEEKVVTILNEMSEYLSIPQMKKLQEVMVNTFAENQADTKKIDNQEFLQMFLDAKKIEGCSERTIQYYRVTVEHMLSFIETEVRKITTEEIRAYMAALMLQLIIFVEIYLAFFHGWKKRIMS